MLYICIHINYVYIRIDNIYLNICYWGYCQSDLWLIYFDYFNISDMFPVVLGERNEEADNVFLETFQTSYFWLIFSFIWKEIFSLGKYHQIYILN